MLYVMFEHDMTYARIGCAETVYTTCDERGQDERVGARARSQVYMAHIARRDIWGAQWDLES